MGVFISCDVFLLDLFFDVWILIVGRGEENIKILLKKRKQSDVSRKSLTITPDWDN